MFDQDSEEENDDSAGENSDDRRSIPGEVKTAKAHIATVEYSSVQPNTDNSLAKDIRSSFEERSGLNTVMATGRGLAGAHSLVIG